MPKPKNIPDIVEVMKVLSSILPKGHWGELSKIPSGGSTTWETCWHCGDNFKSKHDWKVWPQGPTCLSCRNELETKKQKQYAAGVKNSNFEAQQKPKQAPMKNGDIRKLPASSSPLWTDQWAVMGTAKMPYVVSKKQKTGEWQCSCPDWTKHTPRTDCKHILKVKLQEGILVTKEKNIFSGTVTPVQNQGMALPAPKGRKFR